MIFKKLGSPEWLLVCLGNYGREYENTRHNIGFMTAERLIFYKIPADHGIVISDDIALPLGKIRVRGSGSAGGHNGLKNIIAHLGTDKFPRVKVGVGAPEHDIVDWVIGSFSAQERKVIDGLLDRVIDAAECIITDGVMSAQNRYNG